MSKLSAMQVSANSIASRTRDAYSFDSYGLGEWQKCVRMLLRKGLTEAQTECIMRSKWTRWAGDMSTKNHGQYTAADLNRFLKTQKHHEYVSLFKECGVSSYGW